TPAEVRQLNGRDGMISPTAQMRALRELEPPSADEGFASVQRVPFVRVARRERGRGVFVAAAALSQPEVADALRLMPAEPHLVWDWGGRGGGEEWAAAAGTLTGLVSGTVEGALCAHAGGPPVCWCRPALPGLILEFTRRRGIEPARSLLIGTAAQHR